MLSQGLANIFLQVVIYKEGLPTSRKKRPFFSFVWLLLPSSSSSIHIIRHNNAGNVIMTSNRGGPPFLVHPQGIRTAAAVLSAPPSFIPSSSSSFLVLVPGSLRRL